ncbi:MAG: DeoR/GlpR family DNA-binding transcription regulator [Chloroflexota bacterium]|nr:DeoR/GlpR family DNA-binding transcription regulator [Chloroflexota bacterium]
MLSNERHQKIVEILDQQSVVTVADLVKILKVSEMTVRRDFDVLESQGLLKRVHGGAVSNRGRSYEPPFVSRTTTNVAEKKRIAQAAANLITNGDSITLDVGTTTLEIARNLSTKQDLTIIVRSLHIAGELVDHQGIRLILTGGFLRLSELSLVGYLAERVFSDFYVDKLFLGAGGVDFKAGVTEYNFEEMLVKRAMVKNAKEIILVVDSAKFGNIALAPIIPLSEVHTIVTDNKIKKETQVALEDLGLRVIVV